VKALKLAAKTVDHTEGPNTITPECPVHHVPITSSHTATVLRDTSNRPASSHKQSSLASAPPDEAMHPSDSETDDDQVGPGKPGEVEQLECAPKDFSKAEQKAKRRSSKGTLQYMSPCGVKIMIDEILRSESLAQMFKGLCTFMPLICTEMKAIRDKKLDDEGGKAVHPKTKKTGVSCPTQRFRYAFKTHTLI
jgi:hypothetical protein